MSNSRVYCEGEGELYSSCTVSERVRERSSAVREGEGGSSWGARPQGRKAARRADWTSGHCVDVCVVSVQKAKASESLINTATVNPGVALCCKIALVAIKRCVVVMVSDC